jgi:hypothetical protein
MNEFSKNIEALVLLTPPKFTEDYKQKSCNFNNCLFIQSNNLFYCSKHQYLHCCNTFCGSKIKLCEESYYCTCVGKTFSIATKNNYSKNEIQKYRVNAQITNRNVSQTISSMMSQIELGWISHQDKYNRILDDQFFIEKSLWESWSEEKSNIVENYQ